MQQHFAKQGSAAGRIPVSRLCCAPEWVVCLCLWLQTPSDVCMAVRFFQTLANTRMFVEWLDGVRAPHTLSERPCFLGVVLFYIQLSAQQAKVYLIWKVLFIYKGTNFPCFLKGDHFLNWLQYLQMRKYIKILVQTLERMYKFTYNLTKITQSEIKTPQLYEIQGQFLLSSQPQRQS